MTDQAAALELPIGVTESRVLQQLTRIESQMRKTQNEAAANFVRSNQKIAASFKPIAAEAQGMSRQTRANLQNVGYQLQDILVQIQGGQGYTRALGQQLPQLLSGFGLVGVAAGTLAPLFIGVAASLIGAGNSAEDAAKQVKALATAISDLEAAQKSASTSSVDLSAQYGPMADQMRDLYNVQKRLAQLNVEAQLGKTIKMMGAGSAFAGVMKGDAEQWEKLGVAADGYFAKLDAQTKAGDTYGLAQTTKDFAELGEAMGQGIGPLTTLTKLFSISYTDAGKLASAFTQLASADTLDKQAIAAAALRERLSEALSQMDGTNEEAVELVRNLLSTEDALLRAKAVDIAGNISAGADQAKRLADELSRALTNASNLAAQGLNELRVAEINNKYRTDPVGRATALASLRADSEVKIPDGADDKTVHRLERQKAAYIASARAAAELNEQTRLANESDRKAAADAAKSAKSGGKKAERYQSIVATIRGDTKAIQDQITAYGSLTGAGSTLATQIAIIEEKQKLLNAAQKAGITVTPEMSAQMQQLAADYVHAKDELQGMQDAARTGEDALGNLFGSILDGADSAKQAVGNLLAEIAKIQFSKGLMGLLSASGGGGFASWLGGLLSPNANGGVYSGPGISSYSGQVVSKPTVFPFAKGVGLMGEAGPEAIMPLTRINGRLGVRAQGASSGPSTAEININVEGAKGNQEIQQMIAQGISQGLASYDRALPGRVLQINSQPRRR